MDLQLNNLQFKNPTNWRRASKQKFIYLLHDLWVSKLINAKLAS